MRGSCVRRPCVAWGVRRPRVLRHLLGRKVSSQLAGRIFEVAGVALLETSDLELHEGFDTAWLHEGDCPKGSRSQRPGRVGAGILNGTLVGSLNLFPFCIVDSVLCATGNSSLMYVLICTLRESAFASVSRCLFTWTVV